MNCELIQSQLVEYLIGDLPPNLSAKVQQHLASGCVACNMEIDSVREGIDLLLETTPSVKLSEQQVAEVMAIAKRESPPLLSPIHRGSGDIKDLSSRSWIQSFHNAAISITAMAAGFLLVVSIYPGAKSLSHSDTSLVDVGGTNNLSVNGQAPELPALGISINSRDASKPSFISFAANKSSSKAKAVLLVDRLNQDLHFLAYPLPQPPMGSHYVLTIKSAAGESQYPISYSSSGACKLIVRLPAAPIKQVLVGLEFDDSNRSEEPFLNTNEIEV